MLLLMAMIMLIKTPFTQSNLPSSFIPQGSGYGHHVYEHKQPFQLTERNSPNNGVLPGFTLAYECWGELNATRDNTLLVHTGMCVCLLFIIIIIVLVMFKLIFRSKEFHFTLMIVADSLTHSLTDSLTD